MAFLHSLTLSDFLDTLVSLFSAFVLVLLLYTMTSNALGGFKRTEVRFALDQHAAHEREAPLDERRQQVALEVAHRIEVHDGCRRAAVRTSYVDARCAGHHAFR